MNIPKVYIDANVYKFSATKLRRFIPREKNLGISEQMKNGIIYEIGNVNPNDSIENPELKREADLLPLLAEAGKERRVSFCVHWETILEVWGLPKMLGSGKSFYGAPIEIVEAPIIYQRISLDGVHDAQDMQYKFLCELKNKRFLKLQKVTGAYQGQNQPNRNQLLDAFAIWCAEHNNCDFLLTLDFKLIKIVSINPRTPIKVKLIKPSALIKRLDTK